MSLSRQKLDPDCPEGEGSYRSLCGFVEVRRKVCANLLRFVLFVGSTEPRNFPTLKERVGKFPDGGCEVGNGLSSELMSISSKVIQGMSSWRQKWNMIVNMQTVEI